MLTTGQYIFIADNGIYNKVSKQKIFYKAIGIKLSSRGKTKPVKLLTGEKKLHTCLLFKWIMGIRLYSLHLFKSIMKV